MRMFRAAPVLVLALSAVPAPAQPPSPAPAARTWDERTIQLPHVRTGAAFIPRTPTTHVVLLVTGDGGWTAQTAAVARQIAAAGAVVVGVSLPALKGSAAREGGCWYVASDLELVSHAAQKALRLPQYHPPVLVGINAGGAVVYSALANTPAVTFAGGVSLGFCPSLTIGREICSGDQWSPDYDDRRKINALPATNALPKDWYVLQGTTDRVCSLDTIRRFIARMPKAHLVEVDGAGHTVSPQPPWSAAIDRALHDLWTEREVKPPTAIPRSATTREIEDELQRLQLPLEFRWPSQLSSLLLFFSGDGGWASLDEEMSEQLVTHGVGIVGVSSLRYFWEEKTPAQVAADLRRLTTTLARARRPMFAGGFSFGAEVVPVALREWSATERQTLSGLVLIGPGLSASFEIDPLDWVRTPTVNPATLVAAAVRADSLPTVCLAGTDEEDSPCPSLAAAAGVRVVRLPGSHHFNGDYGAVADAVSRFIQTNSAPRP